jgi:DNA polymerase-1
MSTPTILSVVRLPETPYLVVDTEGFLVPAAKVSEYDIEWAPDDWQRVCRHGEAIALFQEAIATLMAQTPGLSVALVFGDRTTFRAGVWPAYKANRKKEQKVAGWPELVGKVEELALSCGWEVWRLPNVEADDAIGVLAEPLDIIASVDKDLLTIPGQHLRGGELLLQSEASADLAFYSQTLIGDKSDNYPGCSGVGEKGAEKALAGCRTEAEMWQAVLSCYLKAGKQVGEAIVQARCARILRPGEYDHAAGRPILWQPPVS